ncbi:MAG: HEAT repeat domain-containing protein [Smithella sp.]|jgi:HEAT repeat protein
MDTDIQLKAMNALVHMNTAIKNVRLYPPASPTIVNSLERLYLLLLDILRQDAPLVFAESGKRALIRGKILNQKEQEAIHFSSLMDILLNYGIKSISFDTGLEKEELNIFISILAKNPEVVHDEGGLPWLMAQNKIAHIYLDNKAYVVTNDEQKSISHLAIAEDRNYESIAGMEKAVSRLIKDLFNKNADIRLQTSNELAGIIKSLPYVQQIDMIKRLSGRLVEWIRLETSVTPAYKKICYSLQKLLQDFISQKRFAETIPIMDVFSSINNGALEKNDQIREVSLEVLQNLASENNINILLKEFNSNKENKKIEADQILAGFGDVILDKLLDIVRDGSDSDERVRIIHLILNMGHRAIPAIKDRINTNAPWYYLRNLAYILGHIGNETSANILQPLLLHKNNRVSMEALKSIGQTGGNQRGPLLLSVLPRANNQLRINIIEMLGKIKCTKAVTNLLDILENKSLPVKDEYVSLQEKICNTLGAIGSPEAIPTLSEIAESKSFLGIRSCPVEVKYAAKRALASIKRKQEENT